MKENQTQIRMAISHSEDKLNKLPLCVGVSGTDSPAFLFSGNWLTVNMKNIKQGRTSNKMMRTIWGSSETELFSDPLEIELQPL